MDSLGKKSIYLDTNELVYARAAPEFPKSHQYLNYYSEGKKCLEVLKACQKHKIVVYSSMISRIELQALHLDWSRRRRLIDLKIPFGFAFGTATREQSDQKFIAELFNLKEQIKLYKELDDWFRLWKFNTLVRWVAPKDIPNWRELTEIVMRYMTRAELGDALHLGAAIGLQCTKFFTNDSKLRKIIGSMRGDATLKKELVNRNLLDQDYKLPDAMCDKTGLDLVAPLQRSPRGDEKTRV